MVRHDGEELKVCGLSGGGNRIRTIGPAPAKALFWALPIGDGGTKRRSHLQVQVRDGDACLEWLRIGFPFAVGPRVRIRLPPAASHPNPIAATDWPGDLSSLRGDRLASRFAALPMRGLTGEQIMSSRTYAIAEAGLG